MSNFLLTSLILSSLAFTAAVLITASGIGIRTASPTDFLSPAAELSAAAGLEMLNLVLVGFRL